MSRPLGSDIISLWLKKQPEQKQKEFYDYAKKHYHHKRDVHNFLAESGLEVHEHTVYKWMSKHVLPGDQAQFFNAGNSAFQGVDLVPALEAMFAKMVLISKKYVDVIEDADEVSIEQAIANLPLTMREVRSVAEVAHKLKTTIDVETLILSGASRMMELVMNSPSVKDKPEEMFIYKTMEAALMRVIEEVEQEKKKVA